MSDLTIILNKQIEEKDKEIARLNADLLRLIETIKYLRGIAEKGEGRAAREDETVEQFVLGYVKKLEYKVILRDMSIDTYKAENIHFNRRIYELETLQMEYDKSLAEIARLNSLLEEGLEIANLPVPDPNALFKVQAKALQFCMKIRRTAWLCEVIQKIGEGK